MRWLQVALWCCGSAAVVVRCLCAYVRVRACVFVRDSSLLEECIVSGVSAAASAAVSLLLGCCQEAKAAASPPGAGAGAGASDGSGGAGVVIGEELYVLGVAAKCRVFWMSLVVMA